MDAPQTRPTTYLLRCSPYLRQGSTTMNRLSKSIRAQITKLGDVSRLGKRPMSSQELATIERRLGTRLPVPFRELLLTYGTFSFKKSLLFTPVVANPRQPDACPCNEDDLAYLTM